MLYFPQGKVVVGIEGIDDAGGTTQIKILSVCASLMGFRVLRTRDPYDEKANHIGWVVRRLIAGDIPGFSVREIGVKQPELRKLYAKSNAWLTKNIIMPFFWGFDVPGVIMPRARWNGHNVAFSDRCADSGQVYGPAKGMDPWEVLEIFRECHYTTVTGCIDVPIEVAAARRKEKGAGEDYYEADPSFQEAIRQGYLNLKPPFTNKLFVVDGTGTIREVAQSLLYNVVLPCLDEQLGYKYSGDPEKLLDTALLEL